MVLFINFINDLLDKHNYFFYLLNFIFIPFYFKVHKKKKKLKKTKKIKRFQWINEKKIFE